MRFPQTHLFSLRGPGTVPLSVPVGQNQRACAVAGGQETCLVPCLVA